MDFYFGLAQLIGVHTLLGLSAYIVLLTGQVTLAQAGFFAIGAYVSAMLTVLAGLMISSGIELRSIAVLLGALAMGATRKVPVVVVLVLAATAGILLF